MVLTGLPIFGILGDMTTTTDTTTTYEHTGRDKYGRTFRDCYCARGLYARITRLPKSYVDKYGHAYVVAINVPGVRPVYTRTLAEARRIADNYANV